MAVSYKYTNKEGEPVLLSAINEEMKAYRAALGVEYQAENVEELLSEIGIMMLMHTGGFDFTEDQIKKICAKCKLGDSICAMCIEFFITRYTFEAWR
jgi:Kef-type K+ transport system membrane component KefB